MLDVIDEIGNEKSTICEPDELANDLVMKYDCFMAFVILSKNRTVFDSIIPYRNTLYRPCTTRARVKLLETN